MRFNLKESISLLDAATAKNLRRIKKYCGGRQKLNPGGKMAKMPFLGPGFASYHLSDYFGTPFAKIRLSCNSLKNLY